MASQLVVRRSRLLTSRLALRVDSIRKCTTVRLHRKFSAISTTGETVARRRHVAIVGAGPAGMYTAEFLLKLREDIDIHIFERLPTPYGLVRSGVAPDHPEIKAVSSKWDTMLSEHAVTGRMTFWGGVEVGGSNAHITPDELRDRFDAVVYATGAPLDRKLGIPGEDGQGVFGAAEFVGWFNGHPDFYDSHERIESALCESGLQDPSSPGFGHAVVVGAGNVALDLARILLRRYEDLKQTDISPRALETLARSSIRYVHIVARRGLLQSSFGMKELRELCAPLPGCHAVRLSGSDLQFTDSSKQEAKVARVKSRMLDLLRSKGHIMSIGWQKFASRSFISPDERNLGMHFCLSPQRILLDEQHRKSVRAVQVERTRLDGPPEGQRAIGTGEFADIPCQILLRSIGHKAVQLPGVPFDEQKSIVPHLPGGGVCGLSRVYVGGWLKRGPSGVIGTNRFDGKETALQIITDFSSSPFHSNVDDLCSILAARNVRPVSYERWKRIDTAEEDAGARLGIPRRKLVSWKELREAAFADADHKG